MHFLPMICDLNQVQHLPYISSSWKYETVEIQILHSNAQFVKVSCMYINKYSKPSKYIQHISTYVTVSCKEFVGSFPVWQIAVPTFVVRADKNTHTKTWLKSLTKSDGAALSSLWCTITNENCASKFEGKRQRLAHQHSQPRLLTGAALC